MERIEKMIQAIGVGLAIFYCANFFVYASFTPQTALFPFNLVILFFLAVLLVASLGAIMFHEWARRLLILFNAFMAFTLIILISIYSREIQPVAVFVNLGAILFFNQGLVKGWFHDDPRKARRTILVIDDDEGFLRTAARIFLPKGYNVLTATSGERGLRIAKMQRPDVIILDVILPGLKGREVCALLKQDAVTQDIPIIFVTAKDSPDDVAAEMAVGAHSHLTKPADAKMLFAAVQGCLQE